MKIWFILFGALNIILGLLPLVEKLNYIPPVLGFIPTEGTGYGLIIAAVGAIIFWMGIKLNRK